MAKTRFVRSIAPFTFAGRTIEAGETVAMTAAQTIAYVKRGLVARDVAPTYQTRQMTVESTHQESEPRPEVSRRRRYRRRDLTSDGTRDADLGEV